MPCYPVPPEVGVEGKMAQGKMTMSGDMSIVQHDEINSVLGSTKQARWEEYCLELEVASFPKWKRACELWSQPGWISRRVALAVEGHLTTDHH